MLTMGFMKSGKISGQRYGDRHAIIIAICLPIFLFAASVINGEEISATRFISKDQGGALSITSKKVVLKNQENPI